MTDLARIVHALAAEQTWALSPEDWPPLARPPADLGGRPLPFWDAVAGLIVRA